MNERRFAFGLIAGILVGLAVVAVSGGLTPAAILAPQSGAAPSATSQTSVTSVYLTVTASSSTPPAGGVQNSLNASTSSTQGYNYGMTSSASSTTVPVEQFGAAIAALPSAALSNLSSQSAFSNAVVMVPIVVALVVGAGVYRSVRRSQTDGEETAED